MFLPFCSRHGFLTPLPYLRISSFPLYLARSVMVKNAAFSVLNQIDRAKM